MKFVFVSQLGRGEIKLSAGVSEGVIDTLYSTKVTLLDKYYLFPVTTLRIKLK